MHGMALAEAVTEERLAEFDPEPLRKHGLAAWASDLPMRLLTLSVTMRFLRRFMPTPRLSGYRLVTRYEDVREVFSQPEVFQIPWRQKMLEMSPTALPFVLATDDARQHRCAERPIARVLRLEDGRRTARIAARAAELIVSEADGKLDAITDLMLKVPIEIYRGYYGLDVRDKDFALCLMAITNYIFQRFGPHPEVRHIALAAKERVDQVADAAIRKAKAGQADDTIVSRLVKLQAASPGEYPDDFVHATLIGMTLGYLPVAAMAGGSILEVLLGNPKAMRAARDAARGDDDVALSRCLLEALRLRPIYPGPWRLCAQDFTLAAGTARARTICRDDKLLVFFQSAMRDSACIRDGDRFDPDRPASNSMVFGYGMHWCVGAPLGVTHLTQVFKPLLVRGFCRAAGRSGRLRRLGAIPEHLTLALHRR